VGSTTRDSHHELPLCKLSAELDITNSNRTHSISRASGGAGQLVSKLILSGGDLARARLARARTPSHRILAFVTTRAESATSRDMIEIL
jgi:hypothetical protein